MTTTPHHVEKTGEMAIISLCVTQVEVLSDEEVEDTYLEHVGGEWAIG